MSTEEFVKVAVGYFFNWFGILVAGYFWLVINHIRKDIDGVANYARETRSDVEKIEEIITCLKVTLGKLQQQVEDNQVNCDRRHSKTDGV